MYQRPFRSDELYHWGIKRGEKSDDHKYVARIEDGVTKFGTPKYRYFYTQAEYRAYKLGTKPAVQRPNITGNSIRPTRSGNLSDRPLFASRNDRSNSQPTISGGGSSSGEEQNVSGIRDVVGDKLKDFLKRKKKKDDEKGKEKTNSLLDKFKNNKITDLFDKFKKDKKEEKKEEPKEKKEVEVPKEQNDKIDNEVNKKAYLDSLAHVSMKELDKAEKNADAIYNDAQKQKLSDLKKQEYELSNKENANLVNPYYMYDWLDKNGDGKSEGNRYTDNCSHCTLAYDMRMRGYDVEASPSGPNGGESFETIESWYKNGKFSKGEDVLTNYIEKHAEEAATLDTKDADSVLKFYAKAYIDEMAKGGPGARGQFCVMWQAGGGHSMAYEVQKDGSVDIVDCQNNTRIKAKDFDWSSIYLNESGVMRTDNLELTDNAAKNVINKENKYSNTNRSDKKDSNDKIDDQHADYYMRDGQRWYYRYVSGKRYVLNPDTGNWTKG